MEKWLEDHCEGGFDGGDGACERCDFACGLVDDGLAWYGNGCEVVHGGCFFTLLITV